jgi:hypothetical protein
VAKTNQELAQEQLDSMGIPWKGAEMKPFSPSINPFNPNFRATIGSKLREWIDDSGIGGGYRQGLINAGEGIETAIDFTPIVGDAVGVGDIRTSYNQGDMVGTGINAAAAAVGALPIVGDVAAKGVKSTGSALRDLYFLHNTTPQALARYEQLGGLPAPSIAVTQEDIPFENFGDITLIGRPERFDPQADKANTMYSGDAYTIRAPDPFRMPMDDAPDRVRADYEPYESQEEYSSMDAEVAAGYLERMQRQTNPTQDAYYFEDLFNSEAGLNKFAADNGLTIDPDKSIRRVRDDNRELFDAWAASEKDKYLAPEMYFDASSKNASKAKVQPYTNEYIVPYMRKNKGAGTEETSTVGIGKIRANVQPQIKSLEEARQNKSRLYSSFDEGNNNSAFDSKLIDYQDMLAPYYKWPDGSWQMRNDVGTALSNAPKIGIRAALEREGFENVPDSLIPELEGFVSELANAPTDYFESKPMRQVGFEEFSGALVPRNAPESSLRLLESKGIPYTLYEEENPADRLLARKQFRDSAFMLGGLGAGASAYMNQEPTQPQPAL